VSQNWVAPVGMVNWHLMTHLWHNWN